ncbi:ArsR/SmtB family transcription factor [Muricomes intestini]|uniref:ArsR/SmtB family transcription factor n=1 Tax=Muricomes intestini TaxID=1796634 RepID=UPI002FE29149
MANILDLDLEDEERLCNLGAALSSPARIQILKLLYYNSYNVAEIAAQLQIPTSSAALYIRSLENAGLINTVVQPGSRGSMKICSRKNDSININLTADNPDVSKLISISMPVGNFTDCKVSPSCGLASDVAFIGISDRPESFFLPERSSAQILWSASGYVEYKFPYQLPTNTPLERLMLTAEMCSEALNYKEDWQSDITIWIDGKECGTWHSPGDYGSRLGRLNPKWWRNGSTQYGKQVTLEITNDRCLINSEIASDMTLNDFSFSNANPITVRIGNKPDAKYVGGFNIFGEKFGDYEQNIIMSFVYHQHTKDRNHQ